MNTNGAQTRNVDPNDPKLQAALEVQFDTETLTAMITVMKDLVQRLGEAEEAIRGLTSTNDKFIAEWNAEAHAKKVQAEMDAEDKFTGGRA